MPKFSRSTPPPERLIQGGNHLLYETQMLFNTAALLDDRERWDDGWAQKTLYMATIESLLVHRRSLMDFYFPPSNYATDKRRESDILAHDFCDGWAPSDPQTSKTSGRRSAWRSTTCPTCGPRSGATGSTPGCSARSRT
jgi:hypothetical protein